MQDDGYRLSFSVTRKGFSISDNLSGGTIIYNKNTFVSSSLDKDVAIKHLRNIQEAIMSYKAKLLLFGKIPSLGSGDNLIIRENAHFDWTLGFRGKSASLCDHTLSYQYGFDTDRVLSLINRVYASLLTKDVTLNPKRDICRVIPDVGILVWAYNGNSVVCYESFIKGNVMQNCMVNQVYYPYVLVGSSVKAGQTTLFTTELEEIAAFPLDESILTYYPIEDNLED